MKVRDERHTDQFAAQRAMAESYLWRQMEERGLTREGGWKVGEFLRDTRGGTELVMRPVHLWHESPYDLECVVWVRNDDGTVEAACTPQPLRRDTPPA